MAFLQASRQADRSSAWPPHGVRSVEADQGHRRQHLPCRLGLHHSVESALASPRLRMGFQTLGPNTMLAHVGRYMQDPQPLASAGLCHGCGREECSSDSQHSPIPTEGHPSPTCGEQEGRLEPTARPSPKATWAPRAEGPVRLCLSRAGRVPGVLPTRLPPWSRFLPTLHGQRVQKGRLRGHLPFSLTPTRAIG